MEVEVCAYLLHFLTTECYVPAVFLQALRLVGAVKEFALEELHSDDGEDEHEEDVDDEDVENILQRVHNAVEHSLENICTCVRYAAISFLLVFFKKRVGNNCYDLGEYAWNKNESPLIAPFFLLLRLFPHNMTTLKIRFGFLFLKVPNVHKWYDVPNPSTFK